MDAKTVLDIVINSGMMNYAEITQQNIVYAKSFRKICEQNHCGKFGRCWVCPPDVGTLDELMSKEKFFSRGICGIMNKHDLQ